MEVIRVDSSPYGTAFWVEGIEAFFVHKGMNDYLANGKIAKNHLWYFKFEVMYSIDAVKGFKTPEAALDAGMSAYNKWLNTELGKVTKYKPLYDRIYKPKNASSEYEQFLGRLDRSNPIEVKDSEASS